MKAKTIIHKEKHFNPYVGAVTTECGKWVVDGSRDARKSWRGVTCKQCLAHKTK